VGEGAGGLTERERRSCERCNSTWVGHSVCMQNEGERTFMLYIDTDIQTRTLLILTKSQWVMKVLVYMFTQAKVTQRNQEMANTFLLNIYDSLYIHHWH